MNEKILTREIVREKGWKKLKTITANMLDGYTEIGEYAFSACYNLTSITIPNSVTNIGYEAFRGCPDLTSITIPNSVTRIGNGAFCDCPKLTTITIPNSVTIIGGAAFFDCVNLTSITIPNSVTHIGCSAFDGCTNLTSITIPNSVEYTGSCAFCYCEFKTEKRYDKQGRLIAYKGFNLYKRFNLDKTHLSCRGFQYEEGKTYELKGTIKLCTRGFHACINPLDCLNYYYGGIGKDVVYHEVYLEDVSDKAGDDSKVVARKITIGRKVSLSEMADIASGRI